MRQIWTGKNNIQEDKAQSAIDHYPFEVVKDSSNSVEDIKL